MKKAVLLTLAISSLLVSQSLFAKNVAPEQEVYWAARRLIALAGASDQQKAKQKFFTNMDLDSFENLGHVKADESSLKLHWTKNPILWGGNLFSSDTHWLVTTFDYSISSSNAVVKYEMNCLTTVEVTSPDPGGQQWAGPGYKYDVSLFHCSSKNLSSGRSVNHGDWFQIDGSWVKPQLY